MPKSKKRIIPQQPEAVQVIPTDEMVSERLYSNYVLVNHSVYDSTLTFCDIPPIDEQKKAAIVKTKKLHVPIQVEIVIPNSLVEPLIKALTESYEKHKAKSK